MICLSISLVGLSACSNSPTGISGSGSGKNTPKQKDVQLANNVLSQTLASNSDGLMSSMYDLTGTVSPTTGFHYNEDLINPKLTSVHFDVVASDSSKNGNDGGNNGDNGGDNGGKGNDGHGDKGNKNRGEDSNFVLRYNSHTGVHTIEFQRVLNKNNMHKTLHLKLEYVYRDSLGLFLRFPVPSEIESIDYRGFRNGTLETPDKNSQFNRVDSLSFSGLQNRTNTLTINGSQDATGNIKLTTSDSTMHKRYHLRLKLINVTVNKDSLYHNKNLENAITGVLNYKLDILQLNDSTQVDQSYKGTINLSGNGYALLKFVSVPQQFLVNLVNGDIKKDN